MVMKKLLQRFSRVADSHNYSHLRSEPSSSSSRSFLTGWLKPRRSDGVPEGHLPVYVGEESARFVISAELLNHPIFVKLLNKSAQEYGYEQQGVLRIPCQVVLFERVLEALRFGVASPEVVELLNSSSDDIVVL